jgi:formate/nitrite transporter FocA (FNT family)
MPNSIASPFAGAVAALLSAADPVADFYRGNTVNLYIGNTVGGGGRICRGRRNDTAIT